MASKYKTESKELLKIPFWKRQLIYLHQSNHKQTFVFLTSRNTNSVHFIIDYLYVLIYIEDTHTKPKMFADIVKNAQPFLQFMHSTNVRVKIPKDLCAD